MNTILLQVGVPNVTDFNNATPYNAIGYSLLVLALVVAVYALWKKLETERKDYKEEMKAINHENREMAQKFLSYMEDTLKLEAKILSRLDDQQGWNNTIGEVKNNTSEIRASVDQLVQASREIAAQLQRSTG